MGTEKFPRHKALYYIGKTSPLTSGFAFTGQPLDLDNWEWREDGEFEALDGLNDLIIELWDAVEKLEDTNG